jgi:DNA polymerase-3 subunit epsilon/ATP-dependent DNA helicase DinG
MTSIVALDIETTGLDPTKDAIIEIGAVRFNERRVEAEWHSLVNPGRRIPPFITQLTHITDQMVLGAPAIQDVLGDLEAFAGDSPILGHNIAFDLSFLHRHRVLRQNEAIDTYDLASVLIPNAGRYNLGALAQFLNVLLPATHRALDDAHAARGVYQRLMEKAQDLPLNVLAELLRLSEPLEWGGYWPLHEILRQRSREIVSSDSIRHTLSGPVFDERLSRPQVPLQPREQLQPLDIDEVAALLEQGGAFSRHFPHYEYRPQQVEMLRAVGQALSEGRHLLAEAGTGTGKSMSYLIPAAIWAIQNNCRVVISTNTINLQDQLINKDIPDLCAALGIELRAAVLKGRANYICPRRLESLRRRGPQNPEEMRVLGKILVWLPGTRTGDRAEINLNGPVEREVWSRISAEDEACNAENCLHRNGGACPFHRARQAAQAAHLLIVNHALLLADVATGNKVLPEYDYLIVDEAHHLEDATTNALSFRSTQFDLDRLLRELGGPTAGLLGWTLGAVEGHLPPAQCAALGQLVHHATDLAFRLENLGRSFFIAIEHFMSELRETRSFGGYAQQERILPATRTLPAWGDLELAWDEVSHTYLPLIQALGEIARTLAEVSEQLEEDDEELYSNLTTLYRRLTEIHAHINALVFDPEPDRIYWVETSSTTSRVALHAAPLHVGPLMEHYLWREKAAVILTSATLTTGGDFDYLRGRLNASEADEIALGSPFDFERSALLYIANDIPEPGDRAGHQRAVEQGLIQLCRATGGRTLVLFTSYEQLKRTSQAIASTLARDEITVYEQGEGASAHTLLETFRTSERAVLLGTRAFWEGVDVPGAALSVLVIVKLPFAVPSDPIVAARSETFDDPFYQYSLPEAILRFRQGFGRLIRTQLDHGVIAIFDKRILTKRYGRSFLDSLPTCSTRVGPLANLPAITTRWLNL